MPRSAPFAIPGYHLEASLGQGTAGVVYHGRRVSSEPKSSSADQVAVKIIPRSKVRDAVRREVALHIGLHHPNIIRLHCVVAAGQPSSFNSSSVASIPHRRHSHQVSHHLPAPAPAALALVMEHAAAGDMFTEVASAGSLPARVVRRRLRDITSGLQYLHQNLIAHLDVKLENVVITNSATAKLIDFGCARYMDSTVDPSQPATLGGTLHYLPPEVVENANTPPAPSSDAWALGVLTYTALVGNYPFSPATSDSPTMDNDDATRHRIVNCPPHRIPSSIRLPSDMHRIVYGLLDKDPKKRMTIPQVVAELERSSEISRSKHSRTSGSQSREFSHARTDCPNRRPRSPAGTSEADFAPCTCDSQQTRDEALQVVDSIQRNRLRAAREVQRYLSDLDKPSGHVQRHSDAWLSKDDRSHKSSRPSGRG